MQNKKKNLANMQGKLSRAEMKKIMAGSKGACPTNCYHNNVLGTCTQQSYGCTCTAGGMC